MSTRNQTPENDQSLHTESKPTFTKIGLTEKQFVLSLGKRIFPALDLKEIAPDTQIECEVTIETGIYKKKTVYLVTIDIQTNENNDLPFWTFSLISEESYSTVLQVLDSSPPANFYELYQLVAQQSSMIVEDNGQHESIIFPSLAFTTSEEIEQFAAVGFSTHAYVVLQFFWDALGVFTLSIESTAPTSVTVLSYPPINKPTIILFELLLSKLMYSPDGLKNLTVKELAALCQAFSALDSGIPAHLLDYWERMQLYSNEPTTIKQSTNRF